MPGSLDDLGASDRRVVRALSLWPFPPNAMRQHQGQHQKSLLLRSCGVTAGAHGHADDEPSLLWSGALYGRRTPTHLVLHKELGLQGQFGVHVVAEMLILVLFVVSLLTYFCWGTYVLHGLRWTKEVCSAG